MLILSPFLLLSGRIDSCKGGRPRFGRLAICQGSDGVLVAGQLYVDDLGETFVS